MKSKRIRILMILLAMAVIGALVLSACGGSTTTVTQTVTQPGPTVTTTAGGTGATVTVTQPGPATTVTVTSTGTSTATGPIKAQKLIFAAPFPPPEQATTSAQTQAFMDEVTKRTGGAITFQTFWGAAMGSAAETLGLLAKGTADMVYTAMWYTPTLAPIGDFEYIFPTGVQDYLTVQKAKRAVYDQVPAYAAELAKQNAKLLWSIAAPRLMFISTSPLNTIDDLKGKKVAVLNRWQGSWIEATGATTVSTPVSEVYQRFQQKILDVTVSHVEFLWSYKFYEVAPYIVNGYITAPFTLLISLNTWNKLDPRVQEIMADVARDKAIEYPYVAMKNEPLVLNKVAAAGGKISSFSQAEIDKWVNISPDVPAAWAKEMETQGTPGWDVVDKYQAALKELGFTWARQWGVR